MWLNAYLDAVNNLVVAGVDFQHLFLVAPAVDIYVIADFYHLLGRTCRCLHVRDVDMAGYGICGRVDDGDAVVVKIGDI